MSSTFGLGGTTVTVRAASRPAVHDGEVDAGPFGAVLWSRSAVGREGLDVDLGSLGPGLGLGTFKVLLRGDQVLATLRVLARIELPEGARGAHLPPYVFVDVHDGDRSVLHSWGEVGLGEHVDVLAWLTAPDPQRWVRDAYDAWAG